MDQPILNELKQAAATIIDLSENLSSSMKSWADNDARPNGLSEQECVGFIMKEDATPLTLLVDLIAPTVGEAPVLRTWAIKVAKGDDGIERSNNVQLDFVVEEGSARPIAQKAGMTTREDLKTLLQFESTQLKRVILSDDTGFDESTQTSIGTRYDSGEFGELDETVVRNLVNVILPRLK
jgi:hypothetical protein